MMSLFSRGASPPNKNTSAPANASAPAQPNLSQANPATAALPPPPQAIPTHSTTIMDSKSTTEPPSHVIHSPLPSRPSPVQPASTIDELLSGFRSNSPGNETAPSQTPPLQQQIPAPLSQQQMQSQTLQNQLLGTMQQQQKQQQPQPSQQQPPPPISGQQLTNQLLQTQAQPTLSQPQVMGGQHSAASMDLLSMLSNGGNSGSPALSSGSGQPNQTTNKAKEAQEAHAGRMLLDSLIGSTAPQSQPLPPQPNQPTFQAPPPPPATLPQPIISEPQQQQSQQQAPRKGPFDFISPMDAFAPPPIPPHPTKQASLSHYSQSQASEGKPSPATFDKGIPLATSPPVSIQSAGIHGESMASGSQQGDHEDHSRRKSIDLLEQLTRAAPSHGPISSNDHLPSFGNQPYQPPILPSQQMPTHQQQQPSYSQPQGQPYAQAQGFQSQQPIMPPQLAAFRNPPARVPSPLRQDQTQSYKSERDQSPALLGQTPPSTSPANATSPGYNNGKGRGNGPKGGKPKTDFKADFGKGNEFKTRSPAGTVAKAEQNFTLDLSLPLAATSASNESLHITPIALLKLESIYVPGCTIGVSHWIAYAMTKGRVRLIARANGARALLKLPQTFSANSSIVDLVTSGNRLAGATSDGGFVVWEVPPMVDDDIPSLLLVSVPPNPQNPYKSIKWHPNDPDVLALSTTTEIHLINVSRLYRIHSGESISQNTLVQDAEIFPAVAHSQQFAANPLAALSQGSGPITSGQQVAAFAFDPSHNALATISQEGQLNLWAVGSQQPPSYQAEPSYGHQSYMQQHQLLWSGKVAGEGAPSSLFFMDQAQGVIIGRKRNTIVQLVSPKSTNVQASVKYIYGNGVFGGAANSTIAENNDFFAHLAYDPRIRCVWAASSHRASIMALRIAAQEVGKGEQTLAFEQILDFPILHPTISLGILVGSEGNDMEEMERGSSGMETGSAVGAMGGELSMALVAYVIHAGGVDQVLIGKQDLEAASQSALSKLPVQANPPQQQQPRQDSPSNLLGGARHPPSGPRELLKAAPTPPNAGPHPIIGYNEPPPPSFGTAAPTASLGARNVGPMDTNSPQRPRSPASGAEEEAENTVDASGGPGGGRRGGRRGRDKKGGGQHHVIPGNVSDSAASSLAGEASASILREIQKVEDGITTKISTVVGKEFRDQQRKLEQMHEAERFNAAEFQDRLVKNLSGELVKSTGRVFEAALKTEVQRTILPALEIITKTEVRQVLDAQIVRGIGESMNQTLPNEIERLLLRPDVSNHVARTFSQTVTPIIERHVKDSINRTLIPAYQESTSEMYDGLYREITEEILNLKKEIVTWQSEALKGQETLLRDMELSIRSLTEQVKTLNANRSNTPYHVQSHRSSPAPLPVHLRGPQSQAYPTMDKMANISSWQQMSAVAKPDMPVAQPQQLNAPMQMPIAAQPQYAPPPQLPPQFQQQQQQQQQQVAPVQPAQFIVDRPEEWEKTFLAALSSPDNRSLRDVLANCPADKVMPLNGPLLVGQTIILSVIHKLAGTIAEVETLDESISLLWWLTRASQVLDAHDRIIHDYLDKMLPNIQENLFRAIPRFAGAGPQYNRQMSDLLQTLVIKAHNPQ